MNKKAAACRQPKARHASLRSPLAAVLVALLVEPLVAHPAPLEGVTVTYAGFAYAGEAANIADRFRYSKRYEERLKAQGSSIHARLREAVQAGRYPFDLNTQGNAQIKGDATLVTALAITGEVVTDETFTLELVSGGIPDELGAARGISNALGAGETSGPVHKVMVQIRAQAMIFDFQSKMLLRAYPLSFAYLDVLHHPPSAKEIDERVAIAYEGAQGKPGILGRYADALSHATLPRNDGLFLQITHASVATDARLAIPEALSRYPGGAESWLADQFDEALSSRAGVPVLPYAAGYAVGNVMQLQLADSSFSIRFPEPNVEISLDLTGVKRVQYAQNNVGTSYIYGAFATVRIAPHDAIQPALDASFKNGEVKAVPATQQSWDDLPAYDDAIHGLFTKLSDELGGADTPWLKSATTTPGIRAQLAASRGLLQRCK